MDTVLDRHQGNEWVKKGRGGCAQNKNKNMNIREVNKHKEEDRHRRIISPPNQVDLKDIKKKKLSNVLLISLPPSSVNFRLQTPRDDAWYAVL